MAEDRVACGRLRTLLVRDSPARARIGPPRNLLGTVKDLRDKKQAHAWRRGRWGEGRGRWGEGRGRRELRGDVARTFFPNPMKLIIPPRPPFWPLSAFCRSQLPSPDPFCALTAWCTACAHLSLRSVPRSVGTCGGPPSSPKLNGGAGMVASAAAGDVPEMAASAPAAAAAALLVPSVRGSPLGATTAGRGWVTSVSLCTSQRAIGVKEEDV